MGKHFGLLVILLVVGVLAIENTNADMCTCDVPTQGGPAKWEQMSPLASPPPRGQHAIAYDSNRQRVVMVGGFVSCANRVPVDDFTWEFDGNTWYQVETSTVPPRRYKPGVAFDRTRQRIVMFGGNNGAGGIGDTWEYDGTTWQMITTSHSPGRCATVHMAYDEARSVTVLHLGDYGGEGCDNPGTTWEYDGVDWTQVLSLI